MRVFNLNLYNKYKIHNCAFDNTIKIDFIDVNSIKAFKIDFFNLSNIPDVKRFDDFILKIKDKLKRIDLIISDCFVRTLKQIKTFKIRVLSAHLKDSVKIYAKNNFILNKKFKSKRNDEFIWRLPVTRGRIKFKNIPYIKLSEYMSRLAEENKLSLTDIEILAVFDNVPLHLAVNTHWSEDELYFFLRRVSKGKKKWIRLIYGRSKSSDKVIYASAPID